MGQVGDCSYVFMIKVLWIFIRLDSTVHLDITLPIIEFPLSLQPVLASKRCGCPIPAYSWMRKSSGIASLGMMESLLKKCIHPQLHSFLEYVCGCDIRSTHSVRTDIPSFYLSRDGDRLHD
jgi:hypothetical protein